MTYDISADRPRGDDSILPFQLDRPDMRGRVARLDRALAEMLDQHDYPRPVSGLVAEAAMLTALIGQTIKLRWKLSLQIRGEGPIRLIATDYFAPTEDGGPARMRAYAGFDAEAVREELPGFGQLGAGLFAMMIDQGRGATPYQGMTPLAGGSLAGSAEIYFAQSEQIATRFAISSAEAHEPGGKPTWRSGGVMLQHLPPASPGRAPAEPSGGEGLMSSTDVAMLNGTEEDWGRVNMLLDTVEAHELIGPHVTPEALLVRLFHEEGPRVFDAQPIRFGCTCSAERVVDAMAQYSAKDIAHMTTEDGKVTADCQFCGAHYEFAPDELGFEAAGNAPDGE